MTSLKTQALTGVKWTTLQTLVLGVSGPILLVIKSRFLSPEDFAHIAIIMIAVGLFRLLESFGISQAIIQRDSISKKESSSLFFFNLLLSLVLAIILILSSNIIASFFSMDRLKDYLPLVSIIVLISGPSLLFQAFLEKQMKFKALGIIGICNGIAIFIITTIFLFLGFGVLGVILGQIVGVLITSTAIITYAIRYQLVRINMYFNPKNILPFLRFGVFVSAKELITFIAHRLDEIVIGYFLTHEVLGIYHFGKNMLERIRILITKSFAKVLFPVFTKLKNNIEKLSNAYLRTSKYIAFGAFPIFMGILATAHLFVPVVFGDQWSDSIIVFQVFSVIMIFLVLTANVATSLLYSLNKPDVVFYIDIITNVIYFTLLIFLASNGLTSVLIIYSSYVVCKIIILQFFANKQLGQSFLVYLNGLVVPAILAGAMSISIYFFQLLFAPMMNAIVLLFSSIIIGLITYVLLVLVFAKKIINEITKKQITTN